MEADQGDDYTHLMVSQLPLHEMGGLDNFHLSADQGLLKQKKLKLLAQLYIRRYIVSPY